MESTITKELRSKKLNVRSKLMAALSLLLVSTILLSSTTYAWFVLSTAPEVKGMSTTIGANGSLEIALLDDETGAGTREISSAVGDSQAKQDATKSNVTWGNLVDLSSASYGLSTDGAKLYPAALNLTEAGGTAAIANLDGALRFPVYGVDGRVAELSEQSFAGKYDGTAFVAGSNTYGVRVIGQADDVDPVAYAFQNAINTFNAKARQAKYEAKNNSLDKYGSALINIAITHGTNNVGSDFYTDADITTINNAKAGLVSAAANLKSAIQYAYQAYYISANGANISTPIEEIPLDTIAAVPGFSAYISAYNSLMASIDEITVSGPSNSDDTYTWADIRPAMVALIGADDLRISGKTMSEIKALIDKYNTDHDSLTDDENQFIDDMLAGNGVVHVQQGAYTGVANFVGDFTSVKVSFTYLRREIPVTFSISKSSSVTTPYCDAVSAVFGTLTTPGGQAQSVLTTAYGYMVDLAFRCNTGTDLLLSAAAARVSGDEAETMGAGSTFTVTSGSGEELMNALRLVFVDRSDNKILGVAALFNAAGTAGGTGGTGDGTTEPSTGADSEIYELHMADYIVEDNGGIKVSGQKMTSGETPVADETITSLTANDIKRVSVLVYLDGAYVDYAMDAVSGTLNLQFASSAELTPMDYSGYKPITSGGTEPAADTLTISGDTETTVGGSIALAANYNGATVTATWASDNDTVATVGTDGTVTGVAEGEVTITAKYTPEGGAEQTATHKITVTAAATAP